MKHVEARLLGPFDFLVEGVQIRLPSRASELIAFLSLQGEGRAYRHRLAGVFWPDVPEGRALSNLNTTIWRLRRSLSHFDPLEFLRVDRHEVGLDFAFVQVDYREFEDLMVRLASGGESLAVATKAIALFRGELLEDLPGSEWLLFERERVKLQFIQALRIQARLQIERGLTRDSVITYDRLLREDSLNEELYREAMTLQYSLGNRSDALLLYDQLVKRLREELNLAPESTTEHLNSLIRQGRPLGVSLSGNAELRSVRFPPKRMGLIGRETEMAEFTSLVGEGLRGNPVVIGIRGEAGIGKSRLANEFTRVAREEGFRVLANVADSIMKPAPYEIFEKLLVQSLKEYNSADAARLLDVLPNRAKTPATDPRVDSEARANFLEAMASWVRAHTIAGPTLIVLEDLHFADSASLDVLVHLVRRTKDCRIVWVVTWRPEESPAYRNTAMKDQRFFRRVFHLNRLNEAEVNSLCAAFLSTLEAPAECRDLVFRESEGNPLFALEILKSIAPNGDVGDIAEFFRDQRHLHSGKLENLNRNRVVPERIRISVRRRFDRLPSLAKRLLRYAAVCGRQLDLDILARSMRLPSDLVLRTVDRLVSSGFINAVNQHLEFHHEWIRLLLYEGQPSSVSIATHRDVLATLEEYYPGRFELLAFHAERAGEKLKSSDYWEKAGDLAIAVWAHEDSARSYTRALENLEPWTPVVDPRSLRVRLLRKRGASYGSLGESEKEDSDIRIALSLATEIGDERSCCELRSMLAWNLLRRGLFKQARDEASEAERLSKRFGDARLQAASAEVRAMVLYRVRRYPEAENEFLSLIPSLEKINDSKALERVWNLLGRLQVGRGNFHEALLSLDRAEAYDSGNLNERGLRYFTRSMALGASGRGEEALSNAQVSAGYFRRSGNPSGQAIANCFLSVFSAMKGELVSALLYARKGLPFKCARIDSRWRDVAMTFLCHSLVLPLGNYRLAKRLVAKSLQIAPETEGEGNANLVDLSIVTSLEDGDLEGAKLLAAQFLEEVSKKETPYQGSFLTTLGRVHLASGETKEAMKVLRKAAALFEQNDQLTEKVQMFSLLGMALMEEGELEEALAYSRKAFELHHSLKGYYNYIRPQEVLWNHFLILRCVEDPEASRTLEAAYRLVMRQATQLGRRGRLRFLGIRGNRQIVEAWEKLLGSGSDISFGRGLTARKNDMRGRVTLLIPAAGVPRGRPLRPNDHVEVIWTVDAGERDWALRQIKGEVGLRRARILRLCAEANVQGGDPREEDIARVLRVTTRTIRSDIAYLRSQGCHVQTRGAKLH